MLKKKSFYVILLILGIIMISVSLIFHSDTYKNILGLSLGIGAGLFGMSIAQLYNKHAVEKNPEIAKRTEIELNDERNIAIRDRAKAKAGDITHWLTIIISFLTILIDAPLWVTLAIVIFFLLYDILGIIFVCKYQKEM